MANTFKLSSKAGVTSADVIYTVATSTTTIILGLILGNTTTSQVTATVTLTSDTGNRTNANDEVKFTAANGTVGMYGAPSASSAVGGAGMYLIG